MRSTLYSFSALQRAEIAEINPASVTSAPRSRCFSALQRAEIAEMLLSLRQLFDVAHVSVLFNEPKLLKSTAASQSYSAICSFSALQRAEIAEISYLARARVKRGSFSALQRAEIAEIVDVEIWQTDVGICFSALQRAEIAEIDKYKRERIALMLFQCSSTSRNC